jgi:hypothetical protein
MRNRLALGLSIAAALWGVVLLVGAFTFPAYRGISVTVPCPGCPPIERPTETRTLVAMNGPGVLVPVGAPLATAVAAIVLLRSRRVAGSCRAYAAAWVLIVLLWLFTLAAMFSIGVFVLPASVLLTAAAALSSPPAGGDA